METNTKETNGMDLLGVPRHGHRMSFMEEESIKERMRLSLLKQCSAILKQGDERYNKESLHRAFQDEDLLERIFRLFDLERRDHLVQEDWIQFLKERLIEDKQLDFVEQVESVAYVLCGDGVITLDTFQLILKNKVVTNKLLRVVDTDGDGYVTAEEIMEFISSVSSCSPRVGIDKASVDRLEQLFKQTAGDQKEITREQFQKIVVSKNPFFTERVFQIFDEDNSGTISHHEFIEAVHRFGRQTPEDKIRFLFKVYDLDGDGLIQHRELQHVMRACMHENGMTFSEPQLQELTRAMCDDAALTYEALRELLRRHDGLLENLSISIDRWLVPPNPKPEPMTLCQRLKKMKPYQLSLPYFKNNYVYLTYLFLFFLVNFGLFVARIVEYWDSNIYVIFARACGQCLNFTSAWVLVLMLRRCITALRERGLGAALPLDQHVYLHKLTGVLVALYSAAHTAMHLCNFSLIVVNDPVINSQNYTIAEWVFTSKPGLFGLCGGCANPTGILLCIVLFGLSISSRPALRKGGCFEVFYFCHLLYIPFWILLIFHAPNFWKWFIVPGVIYLIERIMRLAWMRSERGRSYISSGALLPSRVTHVQVRRPPLFHFHAGDFVFVNVPAVAAHEWHPFTISSAPEQPDYIWLHIRGVGEWTNRLYEYFEEEQKRLNASEEVIHEKVTRSGSGQSNRSRRRSSSSSKKRSVDFSPLAYTNEAFTIEEENEHSFPAFSPPPLLTRPSFLSPLRFLEKSRSMPDVRNDKKVSTPPSLESIDNSKGAGVDNISPIFFRETATVIDQPLHYLYNKCVSDGIFPKIWKSARIVPVYKSGLKSDIENYRPISILPVLSKVFERLVHNAIYPFMHNNILQQQHGFVKRRSTITNLLTYTTDLFDGLDANTQIDSIYTDFRKAFDRVDHRILLEKIVYNGIRGNLWRWLKSYISNRTQRVVVGGYESSTSSVSSGVPHGSILGPLLFVIFINDINKCFPNSKFLLYADDLKIYRKINIYQDHELLQEDLDRFTTYCYENKLELSLNKCKSISFTKRKTVSIFTYSLCDTDIVKVQNIRDLGVTPRDVHRSESERQFGASALGRAAALCPPAPPPQARALAHSFRYMRTKPAIVACRPPDERRRSNESILSLARRRLSKSLSVERDVESNEKPCPNETTESIAEEPATNYPVGKPLEIYIDGPYGAASSHIFHAQHAVLIAAGIGVTPFASILQAIMYRYWRGRATCPKCAHTFTAELPQYQGDMSLRKVDFFWINREQRSFEWFVSLLSQLEIEQAEAGARFLEMHMYITSALQRTDMRAVGLQLALDLLHEKEKRDLITGLKTRTNAGRPNWDKVFQRLQEQRKGKITVFYCGPPQLARVLRVKCDQFGFSFRKEVF
ncbi:uncharacterized protein LOC123664638 [Melitaea cinxia]|uniref:uncharacterized protein LOC123664638 n=1 Tax=Melitaea cinxia TaxID=113334 RepID=UPI001E274767|nr:uncharacterized protein LOC123664638 [Melitaea cinxia]